MPVVEKEVIRPGTYFYRDEATGQPRKLVVTPDLCRYWHEQGNAMLGAGLTVPVPCEHDFDAHPMTPADKLLNNAGWIKGYTLKGDALYSSVDIQDEEIARKLPTTIKWTSPWINSFTDGNGREWRNVISHLALTSRPRIINQEPFGSLGSVAAALSLATVGQVNDAGAKGFHLSRAGLLGDDGQPRYPIAFSMMLGVSGKYAGPGRAAAGQPLSGMTEAGKGVKGKELSGETPTGKNNKTKGIKRRNLKNRTFKSTFGKAGSGAAKSGACMSMQELHAKYTARLEALLSTDASGHEHGEHGKFSKKAHATLTDNGWEHQGGGVYTHAKIPGHKIHVKGHGDAGGGRHAVSWEHHEEGKEPIEGSGTEQLSYRLRRIDKKSLQHSMAVNKKPASDTDHKMKAHELAEVETVEQHGTTMGDEAEDHYKNAYIKHLHRLRSEGSAMAIDAPPGKKPPKPGLDPNPTPSEKPGASGGDAKKGGKPCPPDDPNCDDDDGDMDADDDDDADGDGIPDGLEDGNGDIAMEELLCDLLQALGVPMPDESNEQEFKRHLYEAVMSKIKELTSQGMKDKQDQNKQQQQQPDQNRPPQQNPNTSHPNKAPNPLIQQEQQPMFMSLEEIEKLPDPMRGVALSWYHENKKQEEKAAAQEKVLAGIRAKQLREAEGKRSARITMLTKLSPRTKAQLDAMLAEPAFALSMSETGEVIDPMAQTLELLEKQAGDLPFMITNDATALSVQPHPTDADALTDERADAIADSFARQMGVTAAR